MASVALRLTQRLDRLERECRPSLLRLVAGVVSSTIVAAACASTTRPSAPATGADSLLIVAVEGSNTYAESVSRADTYPAQLEAGLRRGGLDVTVRNEGINGQTTAEVLSRLRRTVPEGTHIVILQVGGNDLRPGEETTRTRTWRRWWPRYGSGTSRFSSSREPA